MTVDKCKTQHGIKRLEYIQDFLKTNFFVGPWVVLVKNNKMAGKGFVDNGVEEAKLFACQHHFVVEGVCNNTGENLTVILHTVRFLGEFQFKHKKEVINKLNSKCSQFYVVLQNNNQEKIFRSYRTNKTTN